MFTRTQACLERAGVENRIPPAVLGILNGRCLLQEDPLSESHIISDRFTSVAGRHLLRSTPSHSHIIVVVVFWHFASCGGKRVLWGGGRGCYDQKNWMAAVSYRPKYSRVDISMVLFITVCWCISYLAKLKKRLVGLVAMRFFVVFKTRIVYQNSLSKTL